MTLNFPLVAKKKLLHQLAKIKQKCRNLQKFTPHKSFLKKNVKNSRENFTSVSILLYITFQGVLQHAFTIDNESFSFL